MCCLPFFKGKTMKDTEYCGYEHCGYEPVEEVPEGMTSGRDHSIGHPRRNGYAADAKEYNSKDTMDQAEDGLISRRPL